MDTPQTPHEAGSESVVTEVQPTSAEMQAAVQQLAETRAALRQCLTDLIGTSVLTWR